MKRVAVLLMVLLLIAATCWAASGPTINTEDEKISYSVGHQVGRDLVRQGVAVDSELVMQGILDATSGNEPQMAFEEMIDTLARLKERIVDRAKKQNLKSRVLGEKFLEDNASKRGVVKLPSGLQYKVLKAGSGKTPTDNNRVKVNYTGRDINGTVFGSTNQNGRENPVEFKVTDVIPGWNEALRMMKEGARWELYVPHQLAFKDTSPLAGQTVIFEIELLEVL
jgi:FKBP-type peptidyl-prolyl cis-trans isomerase FklB